MEITLHVAKAEASHLRLKSFSRPCLANTSLSRKGGSISSEIEIINRRNGRRRAHSRKGGSISSEIEILQAPGEVQ